jgi:hypothetical protein
MKPAIKQYKGVIASATLAIVAISASGAFVWFAFEDREAATLLLKSRSEEINRFRNANPPPSKEHSRQLQVQLEAAENAYHGLRSALVQNDTFPLQPISPQDFQKALNEKAQALLKKAEKETVTLPVAEAEGNTDSFFYLSFKEFKTKPPAPEKAPALNRQLQLTELLLNHLLDNHPLSIRKVRLLEPDLPLVATNASKGGASKKDAKPVEPPAPAMVAQSFDLHFSARPENLREFLNALSAEKQAFFVPRNLKVVNSKEKDSPKKGETSVSGATIASIGGGASASGDNSARYVLGDEHVEVELTIDALTVPPQTEAPSKDAPKKDAPKR